MDTTVQPPADPAIEEFQPPSDWDRKNDSDTLILMLPGFRKEQLRVQVSSKRILKLSGERKISENKWRRFTKEQKLDDNHDTRGIGAKFEAGMLYVRIPKVMKPPEEPSKPEQQPPPTTDEQKPVDQKEDTAQPKTHEAQTPPLQKEEQKAENQEDSQKMPQKEERKEETESKSKSAEADQEKVHGTTQRAVEEQKETSQDSERKLSEKKKGKAEETEDHGKEMKMGSGGPDDGLSKRSVAKMKERLEMISGLVEEVKKQNKMAHLVVLIFLVLLIGIYIKNVVKSSFAIGGSKNQDL
ncbi:hypothetical protein Fmac_030836 [Flemingia macrophylla]|uniref:SHSP domain-containing protein n=1 Tax=Flemingia macrophylla TaxID=520843 RepID=A0ABD1L0C1_9FABA